MSRLGILERGAPKPMFRSFDPDNGNRGSGPGQALTGDGTNAYVYDGENRLVSATAAGVTTTLTYDPMGRLWQVVKGAANTRFLTDGDAIVGEYDGSGALTSRYVHGSNLAADDPLLWYVGSGTGTKRYLHADHLGSIVAATNGAAGPTINAYDEYGVPKAGNVGRFQYTGQIWLGELGLYHYKARLYSPYLGRFLQVDPVGYEGGINLYDYVGDDPIDKTDPSGKQLDQKDQRDKDVVGKVNAFLKTGQTQTIRLDPKTTLTISKGSGQTVNFVIRHTEKVSVNLGLFTIKKDVTAQISGHGTLSSSRGSVSINNITAKSDTSFVTLTRAPTQISIRNEPDGRVGVHSNAGIEGSAFDQKFSQPPINQLVHPDPQPEHH